MIEKNLDGLEIDSEKVDADIVRLNQAVDAFAVEMKAKLAEKAREGRHGWDDPAMRDRIYTDMLAHGAGVPMAAGAEAHIANFAMMLWYTRVHA